LPQASLFASAIKDPCFNHQLPTDLQHQAITLEQHWTKSKNGEDIHSYIESCLLKEDETVQFEAQLRTSVSFSTSLTLFGSLHKCVIC